MSDVLGPIHYGNESNEVFLGRSISGDRGYSPKTAALIDDEVQKIIGEAHDTAKRILTENMAKMHFIADYLVSHETMDADQFKAVMDENATAADLEAIAEEKARKSAEANEARKKEAEAREKAEKKNEGIYGQDDEDNGNRFTPSDKDLPH